MFDNYSCFSCCLWKRNRVLLSKSSAFPGLELFDLVVGHREGPGRVLKDRGEAAGCASKCSLAPWRRQPVMCGQLEDSIHCTLSHAVPLFSQQENVFEPFYEKWPLSPCCKIGLGWLGEISGALDGRRKLWTDLLDLTQPPLYMWRRYLVVQ